ncbi:MAG: hypothetical protein QMD66_07880, partial [Actinomycetota bacterium]|nr:hypothetical protein [Actinomycetota bacterium]
HKGYRDEQCYEFSHPYTSSNIYHRQLFDGKFCFPAYIAKIVKKITLFLNRVVSSLIKCSGCTKFERLRYSELNVGAGLVPAK